MYRIKSTIKFISIYILYYQLVVSALYVFKMLLIQRDMLRNTVYTYFKIIHDTIYRIMYIVYVYIYSHECDIYIY